MPIAAGEVKTLRINTRYDLTGVIDLALDVIRPDGSQLKISSGISVGTTDITTSDGDVLKANEYVTYQTAASDFPSRGDYMSKLTADFGASKKLKSFYKTIFVEA